MSKIMFGVDSTTIGLRWGGDNASVTCSVNRCLIPTCNESFTLPLSIDAQRLDRGAAIRSPAEA